MGGSLTTTLSNIRVCFGQDCVPSVARHRVCRYESHWRVHTARRKSLFKEAPGLFWCGSSLGETTTSLDECMFVVDPIPLSTLPLYPSPTRPRGHEHGSPVRRVEKAPFPQIFISVEILSISSAAAIGYTRSSLPITAWSCHEAFALDRGSARFHSSSGSCFSEVTWRIGDVGVTADPFLMIPR